ncbi:MAG: molybdopterin-binding protein [Nitrososphaerota archaeon]|nr:molybdopterin-binding protein [Candidatus Bathyarchaeota archaeon]MDW8049210.1 molybdopterin-binding protein [Nitrososphaerota archaeon]
MEGIAPFRLLISREEALRIILDSVAPVEECEMIPIEISNGRVLAEDIIPQVDVPPFDRAAMDGYAVRAEDTYGASEQNPRILRLVGILRAGEKTDIIVRSGECVRIATGCQIPRGADAVVMAEFAEERDCLVTVYRAVHPQANIALKGEDMRRGEAILRKGDFLTPARVGVLAALGRSKVLVYRKPRVAVISTGTEICDLDSEPEEGQIYDVNSYTLSSIIYENGGEAVRSKIVQDSEEDLESALRNFLSCDLIAFSGGSSVGERDMLPKIIERNGKLLFHGVQIKPGKPTLFGLVRGKPVLGMPGYPTSCLSNAYIFLAPAIRKMARLPPRPVFTVKAKMARRVVSASGREQFLPVKLIDGKAHPVFKASGDITSMANADGYIILPVNLDVIEEGEEVTVTLFQ